MTMANFSADSAAATIQRTIPRSGEALPVVGLGTFIAFDVAPGEPEMADLKEVLKIFIAGGGRLVDSSPMYGRAESVVGELAGELAALPSLFLATKVWTSGREAGIEQMRNSMRRMRTRRIDLMQVHNLVDLATHLKTLREWKQAGTIRYLGITHYHSGAYRELEKLLTTRDYDFVQFNYSLAEREAEARLLPARGRYRHRGDHQPAVRARRAVRQSQRQDAAGMGRRIRLRQLGAVFPQIHRGSAGGHVRDSRHRQGAPYGR